MISHGVGVTTKARAEASAVVSPDPIDAGNQFALLRLARHAVEHHLGIPVGRTLPPISSALLGRTDRVFVALWVDGQARGCRGGFGRALHQNVLDATRDALRDPRVAPLHRGELDRLRIEIDVIGRPHPFEAHTVEEFEKALEPGIHGVLLEAPHRRAIFRSTVAITENWRTEELLRRLCEKAGLAPDAYLGEGLSFSRFRSVAFIEAIGGTGSQPLLRGHRPLGPADWRRERLSAAIRDGADYLVRAQVPHGGFVYEYDAAKDESSRDDHIVRQLATMWILAQLSHRAGFEGCREALRRATPYLVARLRPASADDGTLVVADHGDVAWLGSVAFALLMLVDAEDGGFKATATKLADTILSLQRADGSFYTEVPAAISADAEDFFPGEAMLALMHLHARYPDARYPEALRRAFPYYRDHFRRSRSSAFVAWQMAAYARLFNVTGHREYADFVFELADAILPLQYVGGDIPYPDYTGGYRARRGPGIASATYNEGILDACDVARQVGDRERAARYQRAGLLAALFTLRLQMTAENTYYIRQPNRALGAFRASLADAALRIDHTQHALSSLLKAERCLFHAGGEAISPPRERSAMPGVGR